MSLAFLLISDVSCGKKMVGFDWISRKSGKPNITNQEPPNRGSSQEIRPVPKDLRVLVGYQTHTAWIAW